MTRVTGKSLSKGQHRIHDWDQIRTLFVEGVPVKPGEPDGDRDWLTQKEISERLRVPYQSVMNRASKERWTVLRTEYQTRLAIERQKQRAKKLGRDSVEFDDRSLKVGQLGMRLIMTRLGEVASEVQQTAEKRKYTMEKLAAGQSVKREELRSAIRSTEICELANAARSFQGIGTKALGTNIERVQIDSQVNVGANVSVNAELSRQDNGRLAGFLAVMHRTPEFREMFAEIGQVKNELGSGDYIDDEADELPEPEYIEEPI